MKNQVFDRLAAFLDRLEQKRISYSLAHNREEAIMVLVAVPGERWEIEFLTNGAVEIEKFISNGEIYGEALLSEFLARYADRQEVSAASEALK